MGGTAFTFLIKYFVSIKVLVVLSALSGKLAVDNVFIKVSLPLCSFARSGEKLGSMVNVYPKGIYSRLV